MAFIVLAILTAILVFFTLFPLWHNEAWWVRGFDFPRFQFLVLALILLVSDVFFLDLDSTKTWVLAFAAFGSLVFHLAWILPYTPVFPHEVKAAKPKSDEDMIRIISSNVLTPNRNYQALLGHVEKYNPDILVTLETDSWWEDKLRVLEEEYTYTIKCPLDNKYGMHVYSKLKLEDAATQFLVEDDVPSMHAQVTLRSGVKVRVHFLHPAPPSPTENESSSERDAEILVVGKSIADEKGPIIVTGDLNDVAWSATTRLFRKISGLLDPRIGRGMFNTFHADHWFARWPLDHIFHSEHFTLSHIKRLPSISSDHFPMYVELMYDPADGAEQDGLHADAEDEEWAEEKINDHHVDKSKVHEPGE